MRYAVAVTGSRVLRDSVGTQVEIATSVFVIEAPTENGARASAELKAMSLRQPVPPAWAVSSCSVPIPEEARS